MLSWRTKNPLYSINIQDTVTNVVLLCSLYQAPSNEPNLTFQAPFPTDLAYLSMLFILVMACTAGRYQVPLCSVWQVPSYEAFFHLAYMDFNSVGLFEYVIYSRDGAPSREWITYSNKPTLAETMLDSKMALGRLDTKVTRLWWYLRYWWNKLNFSSARITFDWVYCIVNTMASNLW